MAYKLIVDTDLVAAAALSELLEKFDALSVTLSAISDQAILDEPGAPSVDFWCTTRLTALLHEGTDLDVMLVSLGRQVGADKIGRHIITRLQDRDEVGADQSVHCSQVFAKRLRVCPIGCAPPDETLPCVVLDPGLAFGTGCHATTAACLEWLARHELDGKTVIDYGCGSGILALAAAVLGARSVCAVDIDAQALQAARCNAEKNSLGARVTVVNADATLPMADLVVANILLSPLQALAETFAGLLTPGGDLVLSGVLAPQAEACLTTYRRWFEMDAPIFEEIWCLLHGTRR